MAAQEVEQKQYGCHRIKNKKQKGRQLEGMVHERFHTEVLGLIDFVNIKRIFIWFYNQILCPFGLMWLNIYKFLYILNHMSTMSMCNIFDFEVCITLYIYSSRSSTSNPAICDKMSSCNVKICSQLSRVSITLVTLYYTR